MWTKYMYEKGGLMFEYPMHNFDVARTRKGVLYEDKPSLCMWPKYVYGSGVCGV